MFSKVLHSISLYYCQTHRNKIRVNNHQHAGFNDAEDRAKKKKSMLSLVLPQFYVIKFLFYITDKY